MFGSVLVVVAAAVLTFGSWGAIDNCPAKLCRGTPPPGSSDLEERFQIGARAEILWRSHDREAQWQL